MEGGEIVSDRGPGFFERRVWDSASLKEKAVPSLQGSPQIQNESGSQKVKCESEKLNFHTSVTQLLIKSPRKTPRIWNGRSPPDRLPHVSRSSHGHGDPVDVDSG